MKRSVFFIGAVYGLITSLIIMAFSLGANALFNLPFFPFNLFDGLARLLPGGIIDAEIRTMVALITALRLGPTDSVAKLAEQLQSLILVALTGSAFGLFLALVGRFYRARMVRTGMISGLVLWAGLFVVEISLPTPPANRVIGLAWLMFLLVGWGWLLASLLQASEKGQLPAGRRADGSDGLPAFNRNVSRHTFLALTVSGIASLIFLGLGPGKRAPALNGCLFLRGRRIRRPPAYRFTGEVWAGVHFWSGCFTFPRRSGSAHQRLPRAHALKSPRRINFTGSISMRFRR